MARVMSANASGHCDEPGGRLQSNLAWFGSTRRVLPHEGLHCKHRVSSRIDGQRKQVFEEYSTND